MISLDLAVAAAVKLFGFESGAAPNTAGSVLIEVTVMALLIKLLKASKGWYAAGSRA